MLKDELICITEAENKAEQMRKDAKAEAKQIVDKANLEAQKIIADAELSAKERYDSLVAQGTSAAQGKYEKAIHDAAFDAEKLAEEARKNQPDAIKFIKERMNA